MVKASAVSARYAVIAWRTSTVVYHSYRLIYQVAGEETKVNVLAEALTHAVKNRKKINRLTHLIFLFLHQEVILDGTMTEYKLTGLFPMSRYIVLVQGERDGRYTSIVTTEFITGILKKIFLKKNISVISISIMLHLFSFFAVQANCGSPSLLIAPRSY